MIAKWIRNRGCLNWLMVVGWLLGIVLCYGSFIRAELMYQEDLAARMGEINSENSNLAYSLGQDVNRTFAQADQILLFMKTAIEKHGVIDEAHLDLLKSFRSQGVIDQIAVADIQGNLIFSAVPLNKPLMISDREHFKVHAAADTGKLYIAAARISEATGIPSVFLSRRLNDRNGDFLGVVSISLSQDYFVNKFHQMDMGPDKSIVLLRTDGGFLARTPPITSVEQMSYFGNHVVLTDVNQGLSSGVYQSPGAEKITRFGAFRILPDYPALVMVAIPKEIALSEVTERRKKLIFGARVFSILILFTLLTLSWLAGKQHKTDLALQESDSKFKTIFQAANDGIFLYAMKTCKMIDVNEKVCLLYGYSRQEILAGVLDLVGIEESQARESDGRQWFMRAVNGESQLFEWKHTHREGYDIWAEVSLKRTTMGKDDYIVGIIRDITERKRVQDALVITDERYQLALTVFRAMVHDHTVLTGQVNALHGLENLLGYALPENTVSLDWWNQYIHPDDLARCQSVYKQVIDHSQAFVLQYRVRHQKGHYIVVEDFSKPFFDETGRINRVVGITVDITARKMMEDELKNHRDHLQTIVEEQIQKIQEIDTEMTAIVESIRDPFYVLDKDWKFTYINQEAAQVGIRLNKTHIGQRIWDVYPKLMGSERQRKYYETCATATPVHTIFKGLTGENSFETHLYPYAKGLFVYCRDITEQKRYEVEIARLANLNMIGEMAASIGHEVRNPMTTVRGYLQYFSLKDNFAEYREVFALMIEELDRANAIITEFLSLAKDKTVNLRLVDLNGIIRNILPLLQVNALERGNAIELDLQEILEVVADEKEIRQCILNLVNNAMDALPGGMVTISSKKVGNQVVMTVRDQGAGIPPEIREKIGMPFFTTKAQGTGLGLSVCYRIAQRHEATIEVETGGQGTAFHFIFNQAKMIN